MPKKSFGPVKLNPKAHTKSFPVALNDVAINKDSRLGQWQELNSRKTISHLIDNLISTGAIENIEKINNFELLNFTNERNKNFEEILQLQKMFLPYIAR